MKLNSMKDIIKHVQIGAFDLCSNSSDPDVICDVKHNTLTRVWSRTTTVARIHKRLFDIYYKPWYDTLDGEK